VNAITETRRSQVLLFGPSDARQVSLVAGYHSDQPVAGADDNDKWMTSLDEKCHEQKST